MARYIRIQIEVYLFSLPNDVWEAELDESLSPEEAQDEVREMALHDNDRDYGGDEVAGFGWRPLRGEDGQYLYAE